MIMRSPTAEYCLTMAAEAERLASIVSYTRDKTRLAQQAQTWRDQAANAAARGPADAPASLKPKAWWKGLIARADLLGSRRHEASGGRPRIPLKGFRFGRTTA